jgi:hypothetical protein
MFKTPKITDPLYEYADHPRYIPIALYFALQMAALFSGGIGGNKWFTEDEDGSVDLNCPVCVNGQAAFACDANKPEDATYVSKTLEKAGITTSFNDTLVKRINEVKKGTIYLDIDERRARVSFEEYVTAGNIRFGSKSMWKNKAAA